MKKLIILIIPFLFINNLYSQYKGSVNKAESNLNKAKLKIVIGEKRALIIDAKGEIDLAMTIEKNNSKARSWYVKGNIYSEIAQEFLDIDPEAIEKATESYQAIGSSIKTNEPS